MSKVVMLIDSLVSGGAQRQFVHLAVGLKQAGHEVIVLHYHSHDFFLDKLVAGGVAVRLVSVSGALSRILRFRSEILKEKPDTVISFLDTPNLLACLAKLTGAGRFRLIVSDRNTDVGRLSLRRRLVLALYRAADLVVANSRTQTENLARFAYLKSKLRWIPNCVDLERFAPGSQKIRSVPLRILCVGRVIHQKNPDIIAEWILSNAAAGVSFDWYGNSLLEELPTVESGNVYLRIATKLNQVNNILKFFPPQRNIEEVYRDYDVLCLPSFYEGTPNAVCEAMASGLPIICSNVCDNPHLVVDGEAGFLFNPSDVKSFGEAINRVCSLSEADFSEMGRRNRRRAEELFSEKRYVSSWSNLLSCPLKK